MAEAKKNWALWAQLRLEAIKWLRDWQSIYTEKSEHQSDQGSKLYEFRFV